MTKRVKFDPKTYQGKKRIYWRIPGQRGIARLYVWDATQEEYRPPETGKAYVARRWEIKAGEKERVTGYFENLRLATSWQQKLDTGQIPMGTTPVSPPAGPLFRDAVAMWKKHRFRALKEGSRVAYERRLPHLDALLDLPTRAITKDVIDDWLTALKPRSGQGKRGRPRRDFSQILLLLKTILLHYQEEGEDLDFRMPLRQRHFEMAGVPLFKCEGIPKDIKEAELKRFLLALEAGKDGQQMVVLATVQFYQARRISEVVDLKWEDCELDLKNPEASRIHFRRHVIYNTPKGKAAYSDPGLKNSGSGIEHPMTFETYWALMRLYRVGATGRIFRRRKDGDFFSYIQVYRRFNAAFTKAGLPYRATHVMRHGGSSKTYNESGGDLEVVKQHLGNSSLVSILAYAQRDPKAFTQHAAKGWSQMVASGSEPEKIAVSLDG